MCGRKSLFTAAAGEAALAGYAGAAAINPLMQQKQVQKARQAEAARAACLASPKIQLDDVTIFSPI